MKPRYVIGIDPGVKTGVAVLDREIEYFMTIETMTISQAIKMLGELRKGGDVEVVFEDSRKRSGYYGDADKRQSERGAGIREGVGSVKRDCKIWEDFCEEERIPYQAVKPQKGMTKLDAARFKRLTGWTGRTSSHSRDAAMLVFCK